MYAFEQDVPINAEVHARILEGLGDEPPAGLIAHIALEREDGHLYYLDLWNSRDDCDRFTRERLHPVVSGALTAADIQVGQEPPRRDAVVVDLWGPGLPRPAAV